MIVGKRDGKRNPGKKCPNAKKRLPAGQTRNIFDYCFRSVPREAAFLRLGILGPDSVSHPEIPLQISFSLRTRKFAINVFKIKLVGGGQGTECVLDARVHRGTPKGTDGEK